MIPDSERSARSVAPRQQRTAIAGLFTVAFLFVTAIVVEGWASWVQPTTNPFLAVAPETPEEKAYWEEYERQFEAGRYHGRLLMRMDQPGVDEPVLVPGRKADLSDETPVVGIAHDGMACALVLESMRDIDQHIVNLVLGKTPLSVTFCDLDDCVRVLKGSSVGAQQSLPLKVGGIDVDMRMVLLYQGERYAQRSPDFPLADHDFVRTTWGAWKKSQPDSLIYLGKDRPKPKG